MMQIPKIKDKMNTVKSGIIGTKNTDIPIASEDVYLDTPDL